MERTTEKINWFGRTYYGKDKEFKRPVWTAFKTWLDWDIYSKLLGINYTVIPGAKSGEKWLEKKYFWNK